jgi:Ca2+-binding EF-hand superfamily protein
LSRKAYDDLMKDIDRNGSGDMDFIEFLKLMAPVINGKFDDEDLYFAFTAFDTDRSGRLSIKELQQVLAKIGQNYSEQQIRDMIATVNHRDDGTITFEEFKRLMTMNSKKKTTTTTKTVPGNIIVDSATKKLDNSQISS